MTGSIARYDLFLPGGQATHCQDSTYCENWAKWKHKWPRTASRLLFEESEVRPLPQSWWEIAAMQKTSSRPGSPIRPWSLSIDKVHRIACLCIAMPRASSNLCWPSGAIRAQSVLAGKLLPG